MALTADLSLSKEMHITGQNGKQAHHGVAYCNELRNRGTGELEGRDGPGERDDTNTASAFGSAEASSRLDGSTGVRTN